MAELKDIDKELKEYGEAGVSLLRIQRYDLEKLIREQELGVRFSLRELIPKLEKIKSLFCLVAVSQLSFFPEQQANIIRDQANAYYNFLEQCANFDVEGAQPSPSDAKQALIQKAETDYQSYFNALFPLISFATARSQDFARLEQEARAATQSVKDQSEIILKELNDQREAGEKILGAARDMAAEQGVGKQAAHFKDQANHHKTESALWLGRTYKACAGLGVYAVLSLFIHQIPGVLPEGPYGALQLAVSKVLIFAIIAYIVFLSAKNYMSHRHNEIVNRHRQNALATFTALAEAASDAASSDIVLSHAAACIFSPQETGLTRHETSGGDSLPNLHIIPRIGQISGA